MLFSTFSDHCPSPTTTISHLEKEGKNHYHKSKISLRELTDLPHFGFFGFVFAVLGMEPRALLMGGKCSNTELWPQANIVLH
jgi:hypothetical protein